MYPFAPISLAGSILSSVNMKWMPNGLINNTPTRKNLAGLYPFLTEKKDAGTIAINAIYKSENGTKMARSIKIKAIACNIRNQVNKYFFNSRNSIIKKMKKINISESKIGTDILFQKM